MWHGPPREGGEGAGDGDQQAGEIDEFAMGSSVEAFSAHGPAHAETLKYTAFCRSQYDAIGSPWQGANRDTEAEVKEDADGHNRENAGHNAYVLSQSHPR